MANGTNYVDFYNSLWDVISWPLQQSKMDSKEISSQMSLFDSIISSSKNKEDVTISRQQWIESLAVASSLVDAGFIWTTADLQRQARKWISTIEAHLNLDPDNLKIDGDIFRSICVLRVRPYFANSIDSVGQNIISQEKQEYVLVGSDSSNQLMKNTYNSKFGQDNSKWRKHPQCIAAFSWAFDRLCDDDIVEQIAYILPVVVALMDDYECHAKLWGLRLALKLLRRGGQQGFMRKSGIANVIDKSVRECLLYRSDSGKEFAVDLLSCAFEAAIESARILYSDPQNANYSDGWWFITEKVIANDVYVADNIAASSILCKQVTLLCQPLGVAIARYLRPLVGMLCQGLHSPVYLSQSICDLHLVIVQQIQVLMDTCSQRIHVYVQEIIAALAYSWASTQNKNAGNIKNIGELQDRIISIVHRFQKICPETTQASIKRLHQTRPSIFAQ
ncbi:hypothetical protein GGI25_003470 [Coemansia spiralis]|uniref:Uncharacterized protein n=2 Tax=Coemansia TaxID=4863 RepID=A0A9W8KY31_9FUNG|nr:hypothetical protein EDC05_003411 [Coemansia umbellata]KAJ2621559.1 hypothetical protein GGI26_004022 [Coemansia sp. RSA 1358]KAJ2676718.1 hypothetical protein GGI25_003470 [Coemansia spiralis]